MSVRAGLTGLLAIVLGFIAANVVNFAGGALNAVRLLDYLAIPPPAWFWAATLAAFIPPAWLGGRIAAPND
jgi:hypothetical protein